MSEQSETEIFGNRPICNQKNVKMRFDNDVWGSKVSN
jgi:hypothetical protein